MFSIAIDGPAGAGKSSIAKIVSKKFGIFYLDTGALYRALAYYLIEKEVDLEDKLEIERAVKCCRLKLLFKEKEQQIFVNEKRVDGLIRNNKISTMASLISQNAMIRNYLLEIQRDFAKENSVIMDGRDIGTVVLPDADLKIFLTASLEVRAKRRFEELLNGEFSVSFEDVLNEIEKRDLNDRERKIAPLKIAEDAVIIDTSELSLEESVDRIVSLVEKLNLEEHIEILEFW